MGQFSRHSSDVHSTSPTPAPKTRSVSSNSERDLDLLQGIWEQVDCQIEGGTPLYGGLSLAGMHVTFAGNEFTVASADGAVTLKGTFQLDATTIPRQLTWIDTIGLDCGKPITAIYSVSENRFVLVFARNGAVNPTDFRADVDQTLCRFVRRPQQFS